MSEIAS